MATFIYDGECGFCFSAVAWLKRRQAPPDVTFHTYQSSPPGMALAWLTPEDCERAAYLLEERPGRAIHVYRGASAITYALRALPGIRNTGWRLMGRVWGLPGLRMLTDIGYAWVARNRRHLGGATCGLPRRSP